MSQYLVCQKKKKKKKKKRRRRALEHEFTRSPRSAQVWYIPIKYVNALGNIGKHVQRIVLNFLRSSALVLFNTQ